MLKRLLALFRRKPGGIGHFCLACNHEIVPLTETYCKGCRRPSATIYDPVADGMLEAYRRSLALDRAIQAELRRVLNVRDLPRADD